MKRMFTFKPKLGMLLGAALALTSSYNSYSQTIIDYSTFSSAECNVFSSSVSVGGVDHITAAGQPRYDAANQSIDLDYTYDAGTEYAIKYPFKKGYSYQIIVNAWSVQSPPRVGSPAMLRYRVSNSSSGSPFCTGPTFVGLTADVHQSQMGVNDLFFNDHMFSSFNSTSDFNYLLLAALPNIGRTNTGTIFIRKVTIKIIAIDRPEFQLTPSSVDVMCGAQPNYTFTVNNPRGISGVTSYVWNVGTMPNGWIYGGVAAPATITTATNSLSLKSVCGVTPKNISVAVYVGGSVYNTYSSVVNSTSSWPSLTITGDDEICPGSSATYTIPNLPCDASVTWSESSGLVSISTTGNTATLNNSLASGKVAKLKAVFTSCGKNTYLSKDITLGVLNQDSLFINFWETLPLCPLRYVTMAIVNQPFGGFLEYKWSFERGYWTIYGDDTRNLIFFRPNVKYVADILQVKIKNKCGWSDKQSLYLYVKNCTSIPIDPILDDRPLALLLSPNPANKEVKLSFNKENSDNLFSIKEVEIMNGFGILKKELVFDKNETMQSIDISDLSSGLYIVKVFDGQFWRITQLVVE